MAKNLLSILDEWEPDMDLGIAARTASLLDHAATRAPKAVIAWTLVTKKVIGGSRVPNPDAKIVLDMVGRANHVRMVLERDYKRGLVTVRKLGVRATVDDDDYAETQLTTQAKRLDSARRRLANGRALVDPRSMKNKSMRAWVENLSPLFSAHNDRLSKLLLPPGDKDEGSEGGGGGGEQR